MKKIICFILVLTALLGCLTACSFTQNISGALADTAEATPKAKEMLTALADRSTSGAKALLHPQVAETSDAAIDQMCVYLAGRQASAVALQSISINTSTGTAGKATQENVVYQVTLTDGGVFFLNAVYLSNSQGAGFISFQIVLGIV